MSFPYCLIDTPFMESQPKPLYFAMFELMLKIANGVGSF